MAVECWLSLSSGTSVIMPVSIKCSSQSFVLVSSAFDKPLTSIRGCGFHLIVPPERANELATIEISIALLPSCPPHVVERLGDDSVALSDHALEMAVQRRHRRERRHRARLVCHGQVAMGNVPQEHLKPLHLGNGLTQRQCLLRLRARHVPLQLGAAPRDRTDLHRPRQVTTGRAAVAASVERFGSVTSRPGSGTVGIDRDTPLGHDVQGDSAAVLLCCYGAWSVMVWHS